MADFDGDGLPDLFVANDKMFNFLFRNTGQTNFQEVASRRASCWQSTVIPSLVWASMLAT